MTREEFEERTGDMDGLYSVCLEHDYYNVFADFRNDEEISEFVQECYIEEIYREYDWEEVGEIISNLKYEIENHRWFYVGDGVVEGISNYDDWYYPRLWEEVLEAFCEDGIITDGDENEEEVDNTSENTSDDPFVYIEIEDEEEDNSIEEEIISIIDVINESCSVQILSKKKETDDECSVGNDITFLMGGN